MKKKKTAEPPQGKIPPGYYCNHWNAKRRKYCKARAGWGTDHVGEGRCKHGGGNNAKHGRYSTLDHYAKHPKLGDSIKRNASDPNVLDLTPQVVLINSVLERIIDRIGDRDFEGEELATLLNVTGQLGKLKELAHRIGFAWTERRAQSFVTVLIDVVGRACRKHLGEDHPKIDFILDEIVSAAENFKVGGPQ